MAGARIQLKRATAASWASNNPVLFAGEIGLETDTNKFKIGDGTTAYNSLAYFNGNLTGSSLNDLADVTIVSASNGDFLRWNGTAWINDAVNLSTDTVGNYMVDVAGGTGVTVSHTPGEGSTASVSIGQDVGTSASVSFGQLTVNGQTNVAGHVIPSTTEAYDLGSASARFRDIYLSGTSINLGGAEITSDGTTITFPGGLTGDLAGNADTASELETARTISLAGDLSGSVSFDGSTDVTITADIQPNSVALGTDTTGNYVNDVVAGTGVTVTHTPGEGSSASIAIGQDVGTSASVTFAHVSADLTGDVTGNADTASALQTARTIQLIGDLSGSASFDGSTSIQISASVEPNSVALGQDTTGDYMQDIVGGTGVTVVHTPGESSTASVSIGQDVSTSASVTFANLTVSGDLTVNGTTTTLNTQDLLVEDNTIVLNANVTGNPSGTAGIEIERGNLTNVQLRWNETTDSWEITEDGTTYRNIAAGQDVETSSSVTFAHVSADVTGDLTGNADTATTLQTARAISLAGDLSGSVSFDGSQNVTITAQVEPNSVALGTDTTGNYMSDVVAGTGISVTHTPGEGSSASVALNAWLNDLGDVVITGSPERFQTLGYDGAGWVNSYAPVVSYVRNAEATTLTAGTVVYLFGGTGDHASVKRADNNSDTTSSKTVGVVTASIAAGQNGSVITRGYANGMDLSAYNAGDILWLNTNGQVTTTKPTAPKHMVFIGVVVRATNNGIMYVAVQNGYELSELHDVKVNGTTDGQFLRYNSASSVWIADTINLGTDTAGDYVQNLVAGTGVTLSNNSGEGSTPTVAIGQDVGTSASVVFYNLETTHDLTIGGNLYVSGSVVTENQTSLQIDDPFIYLNGSSSVSNVDLGIAGNYNDGTYRHAGIFRDATDGKFKFFDSYEPEPSSPIDVQHASYSPAPVVAETFESTIATGSAPFVVASTTEVANLHADTASSLHTARAISLSGDLSGSVSFDGSGDVVLTASVEPNSVALGTDTTGNYMVDLAEGTGVTIVHTPGEGSTASVSIGQSVATSASVTFAHVSAPITGNVTGNVTGDVSGNAGTATTLQTSRTISLGGDLSGSASFNGGSDVTITATVQPNSVALGTDTTGNYVSDVVAGSAITVTHTPGEGSSASIALNANLDDLNDVSAAAPTDGYFLKYASASSAWVPAAIPTINNLDDVGDVTITSAASGQFLKWNGSAWVNDAIDLGTDTTGNYMSDVVAGTGVTVTHTPGEGSSASVAIGQDVATSASVQFAQITTTGNITIGGDLTVNGTTTTVNTETINLADNIIVLNSNETSTPSQNAGIEVERGSSTNVSIRWNETSDKWEITENGTTYEDIATVSYVDAQSIAALDDIGDVNITSASVGDFLKWNGSAWVNDPINLSTDTVGNYVQSLVAGNNITISNNTGEGATPTINSGMTISDTMPSSPTGGQVWYESDTGKTFVYYDSFWVEVSGGVGAQGLSGSSGSGGDSISAFLLIGA